VDIPIWKVVEVKLETETKIMLKSSGNILKDGKISDKEILLDVLGDFGSIKNKKEFAKHLCKFLNDGTLE